IVIPPLWIIFEHLKVGTRKSRSTIFTVKRITLRITWPILVTNLSFGLMFSRFPIIL
ncbi:hypothetical protein LINPERPRIM_LOCUS25540, partial [Linum perenne]